jgi:hypothetical protein
VHGLGAAAAGQRRREQELDRPHPSAALLPPQLLWLRVARVPPPSGGVRPRLSAGLPRFCHMFTHLALALAVKPDSDPQETALVHDSNTYEQILTT